MIYLCLAILSSALVSITMRLGKQKVRNNMAMFVANYAVCALLSLLFLETPFLTTQQGMTFAAAFGVFSGVLYLATFVLLQQSIRYNGVVLSAAFMKLGVLIPTLMAIVVYRERPKLIQILGIMLALLAIIMIHFEKEEVNHQRVRILLIILLAGSGFTDATTNIFDKAGNIALKDHYLFYTFAAAGVCALLLWIYKQQRICTADVICGILIGIPNYFSARFLLLALHSIPAVVVFPIYSVMTIVVISVVGMLVFGEKLSKRKAAAMGLILVSFIFLNI